MKQHFKLGLGKNSRYIYDKSKKLRILIVRR